MEYVRQYQAWLKQHPQSGHYIEEAVQFAALLLSGDDALAEIGASASSLVALLNGILLRPEVFALASHASSATAAAANTARVGLSVLAATDILVEIFARRSGGEQARWTSIVALEAVRAACRLWLVAQSPRDMQLMGGQLVASPALSASTILDTGRPPAWWRGSLTGLTIPTDAPTGEQATAAPGAACGSGDAADALVPSLSNVTQLFTLLRAAWVSRRRTRAHTAATDISAEYPSLAPEADGEEGVSCDMDALPLHVSAELLHILRPLAFAVLRKLLGTRSWAPLLCSVAIDAASARCALVAGRRRVGDYSSDVLPSFAALHGVRRALADVGQHCSLPPDVVRAIRGPLNGAGDSTSPGLPPPSATDSQAAMLRSLGGPRAGLLGALLRLTLVLFSTPPGLSPVELREVQRRRAQWAFYLIRHPLYSFTARPLARTLQRATSAIPIVNILVAYAVDVLRFAHQHHYYGGGSSG